MHKLIKMLFVVAVFGIAIQTFASKGDTEEPSFSNDWSQVKSSLETLDQVK